VSLMRNVAFPKMTIYLTKKYFLFAGYPSWYSLDAYVVMFPDTGETPRHGFSVQPFGDSFSGLIQPVQLTSWSRAHIMLILCRMFCCLPHFTWLIHLWAYVIHERNKVTLILLE
jgi:hypothetical protein